MRGLDSMLSLLGYSYTPVGSRSLRNYSNPSHNFSIIDLLRDESNEQDVAGPMLPAFKMLLDAGSTYSPQLEMLGKAIHSVLSAALSNLDDVRLVTGCIQGLCFANLAARHGRGREGPAAVIKSKNNMLLVVLVLTNLGASVKVSQDVVEQACYTIGQRVKAGGQVILICFPV